MRFEFEMVAPGHWLWRLTWNGRTVADSGESYGSEAAAEAGARAFQRAVEQAGRTAPAAV